MNRLLVLAVAVGLLSACGGGPSVVTPTPSPAPPVDLRGGIYRLPSDSAEPILLAARSEPFSISPNLRWLAFTTPYISGDEVHLLDLEGGVAPVASAKFQGVYGLAVAPDGRRVIVLGRIDTVRGVYSVDAATGEVTKLVPIRSDELTGSLDWSPTSGLFAFVGAPGESPPGLYVVDPATWDFTLQVETPPRDQPTFRGEGPAIFSWSADGTRLAFALAPPSRADAGVLVADVRSGEVEKVSDTILPDGRITWSPDGTRIAFSKGPVRPDRQPEAPPQVIVLDLESGEETFLTDGYDPAWSPDGKEIAFVRNGELYAISPSGDGERPIGPFTGTHPEWLPDGSLMFVAR